MNRFSLKDLEKEYAETEEGFKAVLSVGQIVGEFMKQLEHRSLLSSEIITHIST